MEETAAAVATEETVDTTEFTGTTSTEDTGTTEETTGLFPSSAPPEKPVPTPQAHRGTITGVTVGVSKEKGTRFLQFSYKSLDTAADDVLSVFPPQAYIDNVLIDPATLSDETVINENTGKPGLSERQKYARNVRNTKGDGTIESIAKLAIDQGHTTNRPLPRTFDQLAAYLNELTTGTEVIALLRAQGGDGDFADRLRVIRFADPANRDNPKFFKGYRKLWE
jgi:hypothetical protein